MLPLGLALIHGPAQVAYVRGLVTTAPTRSLAETAAAAEQTARLRGQAQEWAENVLRGLDQERGTLLEPQRVAAEEAEHARRVIREILESGN